MPHAFFPLPIQVPSPKRAERIAGVGLLSAIALIVGSVLVALRVVPRPF